MTYRRISAPTPRLRHIAPTLAMAIICLYFAFYMVFGPRGYLALDRLESHYAETKHAHSLLKDKREHLEANVKLMRPNSLDPDMADEQARRVLGYTKADEVVIELN